jgi:hypothetical protein
LYWFGDCCLACFSCAEIVATHLDESWTRHFQWKSPKFSNFTMVWLVKIFRKFLTYLRNFIGHETRDTHLCFFLRFLFLLINALGKSLSVNYIHVALLCTFVVVFTVWPKKEVQKDFFFNLTFLYYSPNFSTSFYKMFILIGYGWWFTYLISKSDLEGIESFYILYPILSKLWNSLDLSMRQLLNFESFKYRLKQHYYFKNAKHPSFYAVGNIYLNILHYAPET